MENIKAIAVKCLFESGVCHLPVDVTQVTISGERLIIGTYARNIDILRCCQLENYSKMVAAFSIIFGGNKYILYDERLSFSERNFVIGHEAGHFALSHTMLGNICGKSNDPETQDRQEKEADAFAIYLLAPACLLFAAGITGPREIARATTVSDEHARQAAGEIARLKDYIPTPDEELLCRRFRRFILNNKYRKQLKFFKYAAAVSVIASICAIFTFYIVSRQQPLAEQAEPPRIIEELPTSVPETKSDVVTDSISVSTDVKVYTVGNGDKYHLITCGYVKNRSDKVEWTIETAIHVGFGACKRCRPLEK